MNDPNATTTPSVSSNNKLDPIAVLREELAAALCHGVERVEDLTEKLVRRYVQRLGGLNVYVRNERVRERERVAKEIRISFDGGGFKPEVQHLPPSKVRRCHHLVRPRHTSNFSPKSASPLPA